MSSQCQSKHFDTKTFCTLCFNIICYTNYEVIEEIAREVLEIVLPNLNLEEGHKHLMCEACSSKLFAAFNFKSICMDTEDIIFPHVSTDKVSVIELKEVYLKTNGNILLSDMRENQRICRFCFQLVTLEFVSLNEVDNSIIDTYIPQVNTSATKDPVICRPCYNSLCIHGTFLKNCLSAHELYSADKQFYIETEEIEIKLGDCHDERQDYEDIEKQSSITFETEIKTNDENQDKNSHNLDGEITENKKKHISEDKEETDDEYMLDCEGIVRINKCETPLDVSSYKRPNLKFSSEIHMYKYGICNHEAKCKEHLKTHQLLHQDPSEIQKYRCDVCNYETRYKGNLKSHQLIHKDPFEIQMYRCDVCDFETRYKGNLKSHQLMHKDHSETQMYKCDICTYETKDKRLLKVHQLIHKDPSEIQMYKCDTCTYETKRKNKLKSHQLIHKDPSETQMYNCDTCTYETKRKERLKIHQLLHKESSEIQIYKCNDCNYQSRFKKYLKSHQLTHKDSSKIQMYKCDACDYVSKRKSDLKRHQLTHKDPSEIQTYRCDACDYETIHKRNLKSHQLTHKDPSETQMYNCDTCTYETKRKDKLKIHQLTHKDPSEIQMYKCYICNFESRYKNRLKTHVLTHSPHKSKCMNVYR